MRREKQTTEPAENVAAKCVGMRPGASHLTRFGSARLAGIVANAYGDIDVRRPKRTSKVPRNQAVLPYATAVRFFGRLYTLLAATIDGGWAPYVLRFTDDEVIEHQDDLRLAETHTKKNLQDWMIKWNKALKNTGSFRGTCGKYTVTFHFRSADGSRFLWIDVAGPDSFATNEYLHERTLSEALAAMQEERPKRLSWLKSELPEYTDDEAMHVLSYLKKSRPQLFAEAVKHRLLWLLGLLLPAPKTAAAVAVVLVAAGAAYLATRERAVPPVIALDAERIVIDFPLGVAMPTRSQRSDNCLPGSPFAVLPADMPEVTTAGSRNAAVPCPLVVFQQRGSTPINPHVSAVDVRVSVSFPIRREPGRYFFRFAGSGDVTVPTHAEATVVGNAAEASVLIRTHRLTEARSEAPFSVHAYLILVHPDGTPELLDSELFTAIGV